LAAITIGSDDLTVIGNVISYSDDATAVPKPVFGQRYRNTVRGQGVVTIGCSGHLSAELVSNLFALNAQADTVAYEIQIGEAAGPTDGGKMTGNAVITNLSIDDDSEGNWAWSLNLESDGVPVYTPVTP